MELSIKDIKGKDTGKKVTLPSEIFGVTPNDHVIYLDVKQYLANQRQGTHKAKQRNEVSGTTKKFKKQKGTGGARAGSMKSPVFVGGGRVFGPQPRDYSFKVNKKTKVLARKSALSYKATENAISVLDDLNFAAPKTKEFISVLNSLALSDKKTLIVIADSNDNVYLSSRNVQNSKVVAAEDINTYDVLNAESVVLTVGALEKIQGVLNS
ncbi:MAG TPA: 50S ribosomal protein L4 [Cytophagales bacterium]|nr:50S ribosomal protein L4 [Cytophagales bacterium]